MLSNKRYDIAEKKATYQLVLVSYSFWRIASVGPKFEIVSISKVSKPIIQFEFYVHNKSFEELTELFPEAIAVENPGNVWVYIQNPTDVDICFVLNVYSDSDWSEFLKNNRI
jgi:hypothetical protein